MLYLSKPILDSRLSLRPWSTWVPVYSSAAGSLTTVTTNEARYMAWGNDVLFMVDCTLNDIGTATADLRITNLPLAVHHNSTGIGSVAGGARQILFLGGSTIAVMWTIDNVFPAVNGQRAFWHGQYSYQP